MPARGSLVQHVVPIVNNLEVILDQNLTLKPHIKRLIQLCFFHFISRISSFISFNNLQKVSQALITSHLALGLCTVLHALANT